jgi:hypothetical protein
MSNDLDVKHFIDIYHPDHVFNNKNAKPVYRSGPLDIDRREAQTRAQQLSKKTAGKHVILTVAENHNEHMGVGRVTEFTYVNGRPVNRWVRWDTLTKFNKKR